MFNIAAASIDILADICGQFRLSRVVDSRLCERRGAQTTVLRVFKHRVEVIVVVEIHGKFFPCLDDSGIQNLPFC